MRNSASPLYILMLLLGDTLALISAFVTAYIVRVNLDDRPLVAEITGEQYLEAFFYLLPFWLLVLAALNLYKREVYEHKFPETLRLLVGSFIGVLLLIGYEFVSDEAIIPARLIAVYIFAGAFVLLFIERTILRYLRKAMYRYGVGVRRMMIIGSSDATKELAKLLSDPSTSGYHVKAIVGRQEMVPSGFKGKHYSNLNEGLAAIKKLDVNTVVQTQFFEDPAKNQKVLRTAQDLHLAYRFIPTQDEFFTGNHSVELFHGFPVVAVHRTRLLGWQRLTKRLFDILISLIVLPFLAVFTVLFGILIKIEDPSGPIFYKSRRVTRFGVKFTAFKFRSLYWKYSTKTGNSDAEVFRKMGREDLAKQVESGDMQIKDDPRVTKMGKFLRATSLDELPQFINVIVGHMSVVGPRAITPKDMKLYKEESSLLLYVKTGITGLAQVSGRSELSYEERAKLNIYYVQNWSLLLDIRIILRTFVAIFRDGGRR